MVRSATHPTFTLRAQRAKSTGYGGLRDCLKS
jgi:hypothetical protein